MKYKLFTLGLLFASIVLLAQQNSNNNIKLNWVNAGSATLNGTGNLYFDGAKDMGISGLVPFFTKEIVLSKNEVLNHVELLNVIEEGIFMDGSVLRIIENEIYTDYNPEISYSYNGDKKIAQIYFAAIRSSELPQVINKLMSFELQFSIEESQDYHKSVTEDVFASSSVMAEGDWYQFEVTESGVFKITYDQLVNAGIDFSGFSSNQFKMYGFGGMLPEKNIVERFADIPELPLKMVDGGDGTFNSGDYFLFYGEGPDTWVYDEQDDRFNHQINIYERRAYYYFVLSEGNGTRISEAISSTTPSQSFNTFIDYAFIEDETYNLINSGRRWFGDKYEFTTDYQYAFSFDNIKPNSEIKIKSVFAARSSSSSKFSMTALNESDITIIPAVPTGSYPSYAVGGQGELYLNSGINTKDILIDINYNQPLSTSVGWLDYIEVEVERNLTFNTGQMLFRNPNSIKENEVSEFIVSTSNATNTEIWDVTDINHAAQVSFNTTASQISFTSATSDLREFVIFDQSSFPKISFVKEVPNQNLHAELNHDYIIITHPDFVNQANELADFHRSYSGLDVYVTTLEPIYHEFSSGRQDVSAIRDFARAVYTNSSDSKKLKYLLLFGDASMDYLLREDNNTNMVPTWQTYESFNPISSIATDDFFGFLDENEGDFTSDNVDIGIGRFPVVSSSEAQEMVDKIIHYKSNDGNVMADWRNTICFIADDEDNNTHIRQADDLSILVDSIYPAANLDKIYVDAYQQETTPAGERFPDVNEAINQRVDKGALIISYTGHGGEVGWGQERFLDIPDISSWTNYDKLPVFLTATCEFARYDDPDRVSAGEQIFLNSNGGGISLFTTSRATYAGSNFVVSTNFYKIALTRVNGEYLTMGEVLKRTKVATGAGSGIGNVHKFVLLGDPALTMNIPEKNVVITSIVNNGSGLETDTIQALSNVTISGEIRDENNQLMSDFNGSVFPAIYDKPTTVSTLGNDDGSPVFEFEIQKNILYKGNANVRNGKFDFTFIVPKDIAYKYGYGRISMYAENSEIDANGYEVDLIIGGFDENSNDDNIGPEISLYIDNTNFINGGMTSENPVLLAYVNDENGINTTGNGIGHDISATLDNDPSSVKVLNDYYVADANSYKSGVISFPFFGIEDGEHTLEFKVWDIHNNSSKASIDFVVASSASVALDQLFNYPNPVIDYTTFSFEHNQSGEDVDVIIDVYSMEGKRVTRIEEQFVANSSRANHIDWDLSDRNGNKISKGIYLYNVSLRTSSGNEASLTSKLVVIK